MSLPTKQVGKYKVSVIEHHDPESPREEWDNLGTMVCFHRRYSLGDKNHGFKSSDYENWDEVKKAITKENGPCLILPVYLYEHSGITIATSPFGCEWDSGQIGFIFVSNEKIRKEYSVSRVSAKLKKQILGYLDGEVKLYDQFLRGDVWGYEVTDPEGTSIDSCFGFYGQDEALNEGANAAEGLVERDKEKEAEKERIEAEKQTELELV